MTLAVDQYGVESLVWISVSWGGTLAKKYGTREVSAESIIGAILENPSISKTGKVGDSGGVSKTASITLDDTDGTLKTIFDTYILEGSPVTVYQRFISAGSPIDQALFSGVVTSDMTWDEGLRTLSFGCESGGASGETSDIGYAPEENAYAEMNNDSAGKNWPIVFGNALKVPATRVEYLEEIKLAEDINKDSATYEIENGESLPQATPITIRIGKLFFEGSMAGDVFTPTTKNVTSYASVTLESRGAIDSTNPSVFWTPAAFTGNLTGLYVLIDYGTYYFVNYVTGRDPDDPDKWWCAVNFPSNLTNTDTIVEAAGYPRESWATDYETYTDGGNIMTVVAAGGWKMFTDTPIVKITTSGYTDKYIVNLYPSTAIGEVWGKRTFYGKEIWSLIPSSYYTVILSDSITTNPGAVVRTPTSITFDEALSSRECENWKDEIYVNVDSTLTDQPKDLVEWVTNNFTTFTFDAANSDDPGIDTNFAYFETTDALQFLEDYAWQTVSAIITDGANLRYIKVAKSPASYPTGSKHDLNSNVTILKTIKLHTTSKEDLKTNITGEYVIDYSGDKASSKEYKVINNDTEYGVEEQTHDFWAFTCLGGVQGATDFWSNRSSNSWNIFEADLLIDSTDIEVHDAAILTYSTDILPAVYSGFFESVNHVTGSPHVSVKVNLAVKSGDSADSASYWTVTWGSCPAPAIGSASDYEVPHDDSCPTYLTLGTTNKEFYQIYLTFWPIRIKRGTEFTIKAEIRDSEGNPASISTSVGEVELRLATPWTRDRWFKEPIVFTAGMYEGNFTFRGGIPRMSNAIDVQIRSINKQIKSAQTNIVPQRLVAL